MAKRPPPRPLLGPSLVLGHGIIDAEHKAISDWWLRVVACKPVEFPFFAARLAKLMRDHFDHERDLMARAGGKLCECHLREHRAMLALCEEARALGTSDFFRARSLVRYRLPGLVREHICCSDQPTVIFINTSGLAAKSP
jgi:hemerythrin